MTRTVTAIPATKKPGTVTTLSGVPARKRVAAYARVSTEMEEQTSSYEAQIDYYTTYIRSRNDWQFAGMYSDEGISGTSMKRREGFQTMIDDALAGKINLILTKSVSRFARNTVDSLTTVRKLKDAGVEVYFEKENIWTFDSKGELLITIMSSLAQEESRSISENVTWGHRKRFADGKIMVPYASLLGYKKGVDGNLVIDETQAPIVRRIYARFLQGATPQTIAKELIADGIATPRGKTVWPPSTVRSILANEKYKGDALLQKTFTADFLTKTMKVNEGEVPQYYVTGNHEPIINPDTWDAVQAELARRQGRGTSNSHPFANTITCSDCGGSFGRKVWHSTSKYRRYIWRCNNKYNKTHRCTTPHVTEDQIKHAFVKALAERVTDNNALDDTMRLLDDTVYNTRELETQQAKLAERIEETITLMNQLITAAAGTAHDPDDYDRRYHELENRHHQLEAEHQHISCQIDDLRHRRAQAIKVRDYLASQPPLTYSDQAWNTLVDHATVTADGAIEVRFKVL
ncbi:recombinase family protein [Corynebacterium diphtheriae]|uniref:recombinase family protein n=1 Tax=Corynebacterium diphtheriae TaxID=1717 RepID=UPI0013C6A5F4|nr:recombinase family protein [Corynebacterium diphtheriae]CAB0674259.1 recombinase family protein [Corynebacterium diphtheriae]CAB0714383.1 recombinase family protein [Corynebacterium diphtheriae]CAB0740994.1 recombinase family protein [Corynebacterium diphtheriae]CAB0761874.1 recombinase family protein [Corynebacterium diphtheriae]CAB0761910.1 recombinase family protein [Corynebacterium diphtheriae]